MEYTRGAVPPACHMPLGTFSELLSGCVITLNDAMDRALCYNLEHLLKHHEDHVWVIQAYMIQWQSWHWPLYYKLAKSGSLPQLSLAFHIPDESHDTFLPSSFFVQNDSIRTAICLSVSSSSLLSIAAGLEKWPRLYQLTVSVSDPQCTTKEEATAFLSAARRHDRLQLINMYWNNDGVEKSLHFHTLEDRNAYPRGLMLNGECI